jgi:preprotein translocase subunit SecB
MTNNNNANEENSTEAAAQGTEENTGENKVGLHILMQYVRDLSFENPGAPNFVAAKTPEVSVSANVGARKFSDTDYEVSLNFKIEAKIEDGSVQFIAELDYCGVFRLTNVPEQDIRPILLIEAPRQMFPFARRILADATRDGGYPPIMLDPIDFMELYRQGEHDAPAGAEQAEPIN